jgi:hypothetical protein
MSAAPTVVHDFSTDKKRIRARARKKAKSSRMPGTRAECPVVIFEAEAGSPQAAMPPVRIFLGTEPLQYKAERIFVYSVAKHRNPGRRYEIHLMKDLAGYEREGWATGFTRYRFAIPYMAGCAGRAIYNDVDQIWLDDPAELFDRDMDGAALLAIDEEETSVMLMDCEKLASIWGMAADGGVPEPGDPKAVHEAGQWGIMPGIFNARDTEYVEGESKVLHFTTLYKQPWQPFPDIYDYARNENEHVWRALETEANEARFLAYTREKPSSGFTDLVALYGRMHEEGAKNIGATAEETFAGHSLRHHVDPIAALVKKHGAKTLLDYGAGKGAGYEGEGQTGRSLPDWAGVDVTLYDPAYAPFSADPDGQFDAVISTDVLEYIPEEDILWVLDDMFRRARSFVYVNVACYPAANTLSNGENAHCTVLPPEWWRGQMTLIAAMYPGVAWELHAPTESKKSGLKAIVRTVFGGSERFSSDGAAA